MNGWADTPTGDDGESVIDLRERDVDALRQAAMSAVLELHLRAAAGGDWMLAQTAATSYRVLAGHRDRRRAEPPTR